MQELEEMKKQFDELMQEAEELIKKLKEKKDAKQAAAKGGSRYIEEE